ncbi:UDP-forming cellulose synthase catalytic subunit [Microbaculum marinum]|uniref:Cellulose synthase catalytic subunit [UDP-forming] n=1 Tax=Microbaculum marinum TaxID=1764581 RepID=A0AAW9RRK9_9HYPH
MKFFSAVFWILSAACVLFFVTQPVSLQAHLTAGLLVMVAIILLKLLRPTGMWRHIALALGTAIVLRYIFWRTTSTLPPVSQLENFIPALLLYVAELYCVGMFAISLFTVSDPLAPRPARENPKNGYFPTVDVFVPSYNEDYDLLGITLAAAKAMDYPSDRFTVWLLDDGGTDQKCEADDASVAIVAQQRRANLQKLCESLDVRYLTRARNEHAKAGNLNNGLAHSKAELVAVLDADHAPTRDFLTQTVGYFAEDPKLFLVQSPHFFLNPDPLERNLDTFGTMPSENEMFYGVIQRGLDKWNASFFCGSAAVLRRAALEEGSGFSGVSITEDCETAIDLHARGWNSVYVDRPLIAGLQPLTFSAFIGQRSRWAQGMIQIMLLKRPVLKRGLTFSQRLCYASSTLYWLFPFARLIFLISPLFYLFFSLKIFNASGEEFLAYIAIYMIINVIMQNYMYGRYRWPWISELYEYIQSVHLVRAAISAILHPTKPTFKVTAKDESLEESRISELAAPFYMIFAILLFGVGVTVWRVLEQPYDADITLVVGGWNLFNLIIVGCALGVVSERRDLRRNIRVALARRAEATFGGQSHAATVLDASTGGVRLSIPGVESGRIEEGSTLLLRLVRPRSEAANQPIELTVQRATHNGEGVVLGCRVASPTADDFRVIADMIYADSSKWSEFQNRRRVNIGVLWGTIQFLFMAIFQTGRGLTYLFARRGTPARRAAP